ncbi:MAG TPA: DnaJ domain-containing protein [Candidatus Xenobia bacterium]|jgi:curved DNA-binding protein CbpA
MVLTKDSYRVLGVAPTCTPAEIHAAYRTLSKKWHPDLNPEQRDYAHGRMQEVVAAYSLLKSPESRKDYDDQPRYRYRRTLQERGKKPRPKLKIKVPGVLERLTRFLNRAKAKAAPSDPVKISQEHFAMGVAMMATATFASGARREFELSAELDPGYVDAHFNVGICCYRMGHYDECINALQRVLKLDGTDNAALQLIKLLRDRDE